MTPNISSLSSLAFVLAVLITPRASSPTINGVAPQLSDKSKKTFGGSDEMRIGVYAFFAQKSGGSAHYCPDEKSALAWRPFGPIHCPGTTPGELVRVTGVPDKVTKFPYVVKIENVQEHWSGYVNIRLLFPVISENTKMILVQGGLLYEGPQIGAPYSLNLTSRAIPVEMIDRQQTADRIYVKAAPGPPFVAPFKAAWARRDDLLVPSHRSVNAWGFNRV